MVIRIEKWNNGNRYSIERDKNGHFVKGSKRNRLYEVYGIIYESKEDRKPTSNLMYRSSFAINQVPVHNKYLSFLLQAFSNSKELLNSKESHLKQLCKRMANNFLGYKYDALSDWSGHTPFIMGIETPKEVLMDFSVLESWTFTVEKDGTPEYFTSGRL